MERPNINPATMALADAMWLADMEAVTNPDFRGGCGGQAFVTLINRASRTAVRAEEHREDGERVKSGISIFLVVTLGFVSLLTVERVIDARQADLTERGSVKR